MIRTYVVAEVRPYREALALALEATGRVEVVGAASHPADAICEMGALRAQIVLLEVTDPDALRWAHEIAAAAPELRLIALGLDESEHDLRAWAEAGLAGFVGREAQLPELLAAIEAAARRASAYAPRGRVIRRLVPEAPHGAVTLPRDEDRYLTCREREIVRLLGQGMSNRDIATTLFIAQPTVKNHLHHIMEKLGVGRRAEVVREVRRGAIMLTSPRRRPHAGLPRARALDGNVAR